MGDVVIKIFTCIDMAGEHSGNFIHLDIDPSIPQDVYGFTNL